MGKVIKAVAVGAVVVATGVVLGPVIGVGAIGLAASQQLIVAGGLMAATGLLNVLVATVPTKGLSGNTVSTLNSLPIAYGRTRLGFRMVETRTEPAEQNRRLWWVGAISHGSTDGSGIEAIEEIYFDNELARDAYGTVQGRFVGHCDFYPRTGDDTEIAQIMIDRFPEFWAATARGNYVAHLIIYFDFDQEVFPNGVPTVTVTIKGNRCVDPRNIKTITAATATTPIKITVPNHGYAASQRVCVQRFGSEYPGLADLEGWRTVSIVDSDNVYLWHTDGTATVGVGTYVASACGVAKSVYSTNPLVCLFDYMTSWLYGPRGGIPWSELALADFATLAAYADQLNPGRGTVVFNCNGWIDNNLAPDEIIRQLQTAGRVQMVFQNGQWRPFIRRHVTVSNPFLINEDVIAGPFSFAFPDAGSAPNKMKGRYINTQDWSTTKPWFADELNWPRPCDFYGAPNPNDLLIADNNVESVHETEYPFSVDGYIVEQIMMVECREGRVGPLVTAICFESALQCQVGDVVQVIHSTPGWDAASQAYFWVLNCGLRQDSLVELLLMPYIESVYDYDVQDDFPPVPINDNLPNALAKPPAPTDVVLTAGYGDGGTALRLGSGAYQFRGKITWTPPAYPYINHFEFWGGRQGETVSLLGTALKDDTVFFFPVGHDEDWTVYATTVNTLGIASDASTPANLRTATLIATPGLNLLTDGDGQTGALGQYMNELSWGGYGNLKVSDAWSFTGDRCLEMTGTNDPNTDVNHKEFAVLNGEVYELSWVMRTPAALGGDGPGAWCMMQAISGAHFTSLGCEGAGYAAEGTDYQRFGLPVAGSTTPRLLLGRVRITADGFLSVRAGMGWGAYGNTGTAQWDDIELKRISAPGATGSDRAIRTIDGGGSVYIPPTEDVVIGEQGDTEQQYVTRTLRILPGALRPDVQTDVWYRDVHGGIIWPNATDKSGSIPIDLAGKVGCRLVKLRVRYYRYSGSQSWSEFNFYKEKTNSQTLLADMEGSLTVTGAAATAEATMDEGVEINAAYHIWAKGTNTITGGGLWLEWIELDYKIPTLLSAA